MVVDGFIHNLRFIFFCVIKFRGILGPLYFKGMKTKIGRILNKKDT